jgi:hypothetical protein
LECRNIANGFKEYFQLTNKPEAPLKHKSPQDASICRLEDQSSTKRPVGPSIAYPVPTGQINAMHPRVGPIKVIILPVDFSDSVGVGKPSAIYAPEIERINLWMKWYSNGQSWFEFQTHDDWIRAPRPSFDYVAEDTPGFQSGNPVPGSKIGRQINSSHVASEFLDISEKFYSLSGVTSIWIIYPKDIVNIYDSIVANTNNQGTGSPRAGTYKPEFFDGRLTNKWVTSVGGWLYRNPFPIWAHFVHENLHNIGIQGHGPNQGYQLGIMTNQGGMSLPLSAWDQLVLGWDLQDDIYCTKKENIDSVEVKLSPLEREEIGTKSVMIKLSNREVLVIESRRRDDWSSTDNQNPGLPLGFYGLVVYKVNTAAEPMYGIVEPDGKDWQDKSEAYAYFIRNQEVSHGYLSAANNYPGPPIDMNFVIYKGETLKTNGLEISLVNSGDHDTVRVTKTL